MVKVYKILDKYKRSGINAGRPTRWTMNRRREIRHDYRDESCGLCSNAWFHWYYDPLFASLWGEAHIITHFSTMHVAQASGTISGHFETFKGGSTALKVTPKTLPIYTPSSYDLMTAACLIMDGILHKLPKKLRSMIQTITARHLADSHLDPDLCCQLYAAIQELNITYEHCNKVRKYHYYLAGAAFSRIFVNESSDIFTSFRGMCHQLMSATNKRQRETMLTLILSAMYAAFNVPEELLTA